MVKTAILQTRKLTKVYSSGKIEVTAVKDVDISVGKRGLYRSVRFLGIWEIDTHESFGWPGFPHIRIY
jgi:hypothetical protein